MSPLIERCEICESIKLANSPCPTCQENAKKATDKDRARQEYDRRKADTSDRRHTRDE